VLIADDGTPRICDFEMSKDLDTVSVSIAAGGGGFTPGFMCPRVLRGEAKLSPAADMYAFGVLVLNTINPPAPGEVYPLKDVTKLTDPVLTSFVLKLLSEDPEMRPTALELQAEPYFSSDEVDEWGRIDVRRRVSTKSCRQELLDADVNALGVLEIATVVAEVDVHMSSESILTLSY
jgi:serine/threonine protein kinase